MNGLSLLANHPGVANIDCRDCQRRLYNLETGEPISYQTPDGTAYEDGPDHRPQCRTGEGCPKGSPETAHIVELNARNRQAVEAWRILRVCGPSVFAPGVVDWQFADNMAIIDRFMRARERAQMTEELAHVVLASRAR